MCAWAWRIRPGLRAGGTCSGVVRTAAGRGRRPGIRRCGMVAVASRRPWNIRRRAGIRLRSLLGLVLLRVVCRWRAVILRRRRLLNMAGLMRRRLSWVHVRVRGRIALRGRSRVGRRNRSADVRRLRNDVLRTSLWRVSRSWRGVRSGVALGRTRNVLRRVPVHRVRAVRTHVSRRLRSIVGV